MDSEMNRTPSWRPTTREPDNPARKDKVTYLIVVVSATKHELMRQEVTGPEMIVLAVAETMEKYANVTPKGTTLISRRRECGSYTEPTPLAIWRKDYQRQIAFQRIRW